jgi:two-component system response regulator FixJ
MPDASVVHVIDDDEAVRESLTFLLRAAEIPVRSYDSAKVFLATAPKAEPGCVVTDVRMPEMSGIELLHALKASNIALPVIVITGHGDVPLAVEAMKAGAQDFIEKPFDDNTVLTAIRTALGRHQENSKRHMEQAEIGKKLENLSARERQVLEGLIGGLPNKSIAFDLGISPRTVEVYRANLMTKMDANSFSELVRMALIAGVAGDRKIP